jgi:hypothetical protein
MKNEQYYYNSLTRLYDDSFEDVAYIIDLDVKRTIEATKSEKFSQKLNRILLSYAK